MKKLFIPVAFCFLCLSACAQTSALDRFYDKFKSSGTSDANISISPNLMLSACFQGKGREEDNWLKKVTQVRMLIIDAKKAPSSKEWSDLSGSLLADHFDELMSVRKGRDRVQLMSADRGADLKEVVFLAAGQDGGGILLHFKGHFTTADLAKMQFALQEKNEQKNEQ